VRASSTSVASRGTCTRGGSCSFGFATGGDDGARRGGRRIVRGSGCGRLRGRGIIDIRQRDEAFAEDVLVREQVRDAVGDGLRFRDIDLLERQLARLVAHVDRADELAAQIHRRREHAVRR
jgi:hypothetical protein